MRKNIGTALIVAVGIVVGAWLLQSDPSLAANFDPSNPPVTTGCVVRFHSTGPRIHENSAHMCTGANTVEMDGEGNLVVRSDWHGAVISITVESDECLTRRNIDGGASNGLGTTRIEFYRETEHVRLDDSRMWGEFCNVWLTWHHAGVDGPAPSPTATSSG